MSASYLWRRAYKYTFRNLNTTLLDLKPPIVSNFFSTSDEDADIDESSTFKLLHGHKINWLSGFMDTSTLLLYVCDESSVVTKYSVR